MEGDVIQLRDIGHSTLDLLRDRGVIPADYPPAWLPSEGKSWFGPDYHLPVNVAPSGATDPGPASATTANPPTPAATHAATAGAVGATGAHGEIGANKA